jgi:hypothetical protein
VMKKAFTAVTEAAWLFSCRHRSTNKCHCLTTPHSHYRRNARNKPCVAPPLLFFFPFVWSLYLRGIIVETEACEFQFMLCPRQHTCTFVSRSYSFFNLSCIFQKKKFCKHSSCAVLFLFIVHGHSFNIHCNIHTRSARIIIIATLPHNRQSLPE